SAKLHTFHGLRSNTALDYAPFVPYLDLDAVYSGDELSKRSPADPYLLSLKAYNRKGFKPHLVIEGRYEDLTGQGNATGTAYTKDRGRLRRQAYWTCLSGAAGHLF